MLMFNISCIIAYRCRPIFIICSLSILTSAVSLAVMTSLQTSMARCIHAKYNCSSNEHLWSEKEIDSQEAQDNFFLINHIMKYSHYYIMVQNNHPEHSRNHPHCLFNISSTCRYFQYYTRSFIKIIRLVSWCFCLFVFVSNNKFWIYIFSIAHKIFQFICG